MAHNLELINGKASMAYAGEKPWHGLGKEVPYDLTPEQMLEAANLDWEVNKFPLFTEINGERISVGKEALVRSSDNKVLDVVSNDWKPVQNAEAFGFFHDFVMAGDMDMNTAGALDDGKIVWALAKVKDGFTILGKDDVELYLLFTNPHKYGKSIDIRMTATRVVCQNTLMMALNGKADMMINLNHRTAFNPELVKKTLGIAHTKLETYKEVAELLSSKRFKEEDVSTYINRIFPIDKDGSMSRTGATVKAVIETQPGANLGEGTFWSLFNAVTYSTDHVLGRAPETRLKSSWYGPNRIRKIEALNIAVEMAEAA
jgi:phage/plasmid-like protein (TIGR03299 family)